MVFSLIFIVLYTIVSLIMTYATGVPEPSTLTACVFTYFSVESILLMIKKLKRGDENEPNNSNDSNDNECYDIPDERDSRDCERDITISESSDEFSSAVRSAIINEPKYLRIFRF